MGVCGCCCPSEEPTKNEKKVKAVELKKKHSYQPVDLEEEEEEPTNEVMERNSTESQEKNNAYEDLIVEQTYAMTDGRNATGKKPVLSSKSKNNDEDPIIQQTYAMTDARNPTGKKPVLSSQQNDDDDDDDSIHLAITDKPRRADSITVRSKTTSAPSVSSFDSSSSSASRVSLSHLAVVEQNILSGELDPEYVEAVANAETVALSPKKRELTHQEMVATASAARVAEGKIDEEEGDIGDGGGGGGDSITLKELEEEEFDFSKHEFTLNRRASQEEVNAMFIQIYYDRFLKSEQGNVVKAAKRCHETFKWRKAERADYALEQGYPNFWAIKCCVPHCFHGRDKEGRLVIYQKPSDMKLWILESMGLSQDTFVQHYIFLEEYLAKYIHLNDDDAVLKVIDLSGLKSSDLTKEFRAILRTSLKIGTHYPGRTVKVIFINKPMWASVLFSFIKSILSTQEQKKIISFNPKNSLNGMLEYIDEDQIPRGLGGTNDVPLGCGEDEIKLYKEVKQLNESYDQEMVLLDETKLKMVNGFVPKPPDGYQEFTSF